MSVFHCPLCPLIFEYRTEVEYHLRNEHRSRADEKAALAAELAVAVRELDWEQLRALQSSTSGVAVTILMTTIPGASMSTLDVARLRRLAFQARSRLTAEPGPVAANLEERLNSTVVVAESAPTQDGLAILVSANELAIFHLPFEPVDRVVIDPSFATRDLEATLQCYPRYRVVVLGLSPRLFEGRGLHLKEIDISSVRGDGIVRDDSKDRPGKRSVRPERWTIGQSRRRSAVESIDQILGERTGSAGDLPLVVAGDGRWRSTFHKHSRHTASIVGEIAGTRHRDTPPGLARLAEPFLALRLREEQAAALAELDRAGSQQAVTWGIQAAWTAVQAGTADLLWVDEGLSHPARLTGSSTALELVDDPTQPGVIDDIVDDLIESAIASGVGVHLLARGAMGTTEPVAARLRPHTLKAKASAAAQAG